MNARLGLVAGAFLAAMPSLAAAQDDARPPVSSSQREDRQPVSSGPEPRAPASPSARATNRIELDATQITGNRELPKVLYIVPWKRSDLGELVGKPVNSLLDEVLAPVDRDVFRRENRYYQTVRPDRSGSGGKTDAQPSAEAAGPEK